MNAVESAPSVAAQRGGRLLRPRPWWVRAAAVSAALAWLPAGAAVVAFSTVASAPFGWVYSASIFGVGLYAAAWAFGATPRVAGATVVPALVLGVAMHMWAPPDHDRLRSVAEDVGIDITGWTLVGDGELGNTWCWQGCPALSYFYLAPESPGRAVERVTGRLAADGWVDGRLRRSGDPRSEYAPRALEQWHRGDWTVLVHVSATAHPPQWAKSADPRLTPVTVTYGAR